MCVSQPTQAISHVSFLPSPHVLHFRRLFFTREDKPRIRYHFSPRLMFSISVFTSLGTSPSSQSQVPFLTSPHVLHFRLHKPWNISVFTSLGYGTIFHLASCSPSSYSPSPVAHFIRFVFTSLGCSAIFHLASCSPSLVAHFIGFVVAICTS